MNKELYRILFNIVVLLVVLLISAAAIMLPTRSTDLHWIFFINIYNLGILTTVAIYDLHKSLRRDTPAVRPNNPVTQNYRTFAMVAMTIALTVILAFMLIRK